MCASLLQAQSYLGAFKAEPTCIDINTDSTIAQSDLTEWKKATKPSPQHHHPFWLIDASNEDNNIEKKTIICISDTPPSDCRSSLAVAQNYTLVGTRYYRVVPGQVTNTDAEVDCQAAGAELAVFKTEADWNEVMEFISEMESICTLLYTLAAFTA